jgi:hypothetical protein
MFKLRAPWAVMATAALLGCNSSGVVINDRVPKETLELSKELGGLLAKVRPAAESGELPLLFVSGAQLPKDTKGYSKFNFGLGQLPTGGGEEINAIVDIGVPNMGDPFQATWTFRRENGEWKIGAAPLPNGHAAPRRNTDQG